MKSERYKLVNEQIPEQFTPNDTVLVTRKNRKKRCWHVKGENGNPLCRIQEVEHGFREAELISIVPVYDICSLCEEKLNPSKTLE